MPLPRPARPSGADHDAQVTALVQRLGRERRHEVAKLHRDLFGEPLSAVLLRGERPGVGVGSVVDRHARLTVIASIGDIDETATGIPGGVQVLVSVVGHHRQLGRRVPVDAAEEEAWARLAVGPEWQPYLYREVNLLTQVNDEAGAGFFTVFLDADRRPVHLPDGNAWPTSLQPLPVL